MSIGPLPRRARNAAASVQLRIPPPDSLKRVREHVEVDVVGRAAPRAGAARARAARGRARSGNGKSITKSSRRRNASSMLRRKFVARMTTPS